MDERRFENPSDMKQYLKITSFDELYSQTRPLSVHEQMEEFMFLGLRKTKGISKINSKSVSAVLWILFMRNL